MNVGFDSPQPTFHILRVTIRSATYQLPPELAYSQKNRNTLYLRRTGATTNDYWQWFAVV